MRKIQIPVGDITLSARTAGDKSQPALVLLHGWPQSSRIYDEVIPMLGEDSYVLAFDLPGIGDSHGVPASGEKTALADILLTASEAAGATDILLAGFDVGGMIAYAAARDYGSRISGAVVANTVIPGLEPWLQVVTDPRIFHFAFHNVPELPEKLIAGKERLYFDFFFNALAGDADKLTDSQRDEYARAYSRPEALSAGFSWYRTLEADAKHNARHKKIETPIHYLRGDADGGMSKVQQYVGGIEKAGAVNVTGGVVRNSGEFLPVEAPEAFVKALKDYRATLGKARAAA